MKIRIQSILIALLLALANAVQAGTFNYTNSDGIWAYSTNGGAATIVDYTGSATDVIIPDTVTGGRPVTAIGSSALQLSSFTSVTIPAGITSIGDGAFYHCFSLGSITVPIGVASLGTSVFQGDNSLTNVVLPEGLSSIGNSAFYGCTNLKTFTIPDTVLSIGNSAFYNCSNLKTIVLPDSVTSLQLDAFGYCTSLTNVTFGSGLTLIGNWAFEHCTSLPSVNIPATVTVIGTNAFSFCGLTSVTIPSSVTNIQFAAFTWCTNLTSVVLPAKLASIGHGAFESCGNLRAPYFLGNAPPDFGDAFGNDSLATVYYLPGTTGWGATFGSRPTMLWNPQATAAGVTGGLFGFTITGPTNAVIVVIACTDLSNPAWIPVSTNTLTAGTSVFSDPQTSACPRRFYRFSSR